MHLMKTEDDIHLMVTIELVVLFLSLPHGYLKGISNKVAYELVH